MTRPRQKSTRARKEPVTLATRQHNERIRTAIDRLVEADVEDDRRIRFGEPYAVIVRTGEALAEDGTTFEHAAMVILRARSIDEAKNLALDAANTRFRCAYVAVDAFVPDPPGALGAITGDPIWFECPLPREVPVEALDVDLA